MERRQFGRGGSPSRREIARNCEVFARFRGRGRTCVGGRGNRGRSCCGAGGPPAAATGGSRPAARRRRRAASGGRSRPSGRVLLPVRRDCCLSWLPKHARRSGRHGLGVGYLLEPSADVEVEDFRRIRFVASLRRDLNASTCGATRRSSIGRFRVVGAHGTNGLESAYGARVLVDQLFPAPRTANRRTPATDARPPKPMFLHAWRRHSATPAA